MAVPAQQSLPWVAILAGGAIVVAVFGIRHAFGLFIDPIAGALAITSASIAFGVAVQNLLWGVVQPVAGRIADRYSALWVLAAGVILYSTGLAWLGTAQTGTMVQIGLVLFCGLGLTGASMTIVLALVGKQVAPHRRSTALGLASTSGSVGQFAMTPLCFWLLASLGWRDGLLALSVVVALIGLAALLLIKRLCPGPIAYKETVLSLNAEDDDNPRVPPATARRGMILLCTGFFVCGFQVVLIMTHLPPFLADVGLSASVAATALSLIGFFNIIGTMGAGWLGDRWHKSWLLAAIYAVRALALGVFALVSPLTPTVVYGLCVVIGLGWLATIPLTSGLAADFCRRRNLGVVFGMVFLCHQTGAFLGAWGGGWWRDWYGGYESFWLVAALLGILASLLHVFIPRVPVLPRHGASLPQ